MNEMALSDENMDKIEEDVNSVAKNSEEVIDKIEKSDDTDISNKGDANDDEVALGELGNFKKCSKEDMNDVFDHLSGTLFQLKGCMFRVSYIHRGQGRFTASILNLEGTEPDLETKVEG